MPSSATDRYITAPTDRSIPAVSRTKVMPMPRIAICDAWIRILVKFWTSRNRSDSDPNTASTTTNRATGAFRSRARRRRTVFMSRHLFRSDAGSSDRSPPLHRSLQDASAVELPARILRLDLAMVHHQDAVAQAHQFLHLGGD